MNRHNDPTNEKAPGAINTEGLVTDTTHADHFPTNRQKSKAFADTTARVNRETVQVERGDRGHFFVLKNGSAIELCVDFAALQAFERSLPKAKAGGQS